MNEEKIAQLLKLSEEFDTLKRIIHACHRDYDEVGVDETTAKANDIFKAGQALRAELTAEEVQEFERRVRAKRHR